jgi:DEAD/DEAH box helicase domain-containing protein
VLAEEGFVHLVDGQWQWTQESYPADAVSLRSVTSDNFVIVDMTNGERVIGETDFTSGPSTLHEKGHLHHRRPAVSGGAVRLRQSQGLRALG